MANYTYSCPSCGHTEDVTHPITDCDTPSVKTQLKTSCNGYTCPVVKRGLLSSDQNVSLGTAWKRVPTSANFLSFGSGTHDTGGLKSLNQKSDFAKKRSLDHSKKEGIDEFKREHHKSIKKDLI